LKIAVVRAKERGETDRLISETAAFLLAQGVNLAGIVKVLGEDDDANQCREMAVQVLPDGAVIAITQDLGEGSDACKLDPGAIAQAVAEVERQPIENVQLFILNKFGPQEADGRGFRDAIATALAAGIPVLVGVGGSSRAGFDAFVDGLAETLPSDAGAIRDWCLKAMA